MTNWSFFKAKVPSRRDRLWINYKSNVLYGSSLETLHQIYSCDLELEQQVCALSKLEDYFGIEKELMDTFRKFFSFIESEITFEVFSFYLWNICSMDHGDLASFIFGLYTNKGSEVICRDHLIEVLKSFNNIAYENSKCILPHVKYSAKTFSLFCKENKDFLWPVVRMQEIIRNKCLGRSFWVKKTKKRLLKRQADDHIELKGRQQQAVTVDAVFNYFYELRLKSTPLVTVATNFYSSQSYHSTIGEDEIYCFKKNPYSCLLSIHSSRPESSVMNMCSDCTTRCCTGTGATALQAQAQGQGILLEGGLEHIALHDTDFSEMFALDSACKSTFDSYRNQAKLISGRTQQKQQQKLANKQRSSFVKQVGRKRQTAANVVAISTHPCHNSTAAGDISNHHTTWKEELEEERHNSYSNSNSSNGGVVVRSNHAGVVKHKKKHKLLSPPAWRNKRAQVCPM